MVSKVTQSGSKNAKIVPKVAPRVPKGHQKGTKMEPDVVTKYQKCAQSGDQKIEKNTNGGLLLSYICIYIYI